MNCCIAIITYKERLGDNELKSFSKAFSIFKERPIKIILPDNINDDFYTQYNAELIKINPSNFVNVRAYSKMLCQAWFYKLFKGFDYILIYQTDCWVFEDRLDYFMSLNHDYYGAPWPNFNGKIGNGGLSLRKISKMIEITSKGNGNPYGKNEDMWFCLDHEKELDKPPLNVAANFSIELGIDKYAPLVNDIPMGLHGKYIELMELWDDGTKFMEKYKKVK